MFSDWAFILLLLSIAAPVTGRAASLCDKPSDFTSQIGPVKSQDNLRFCFGFAGVSLIEQYSCKVKPGSCESMKQKGGFSVADALAQDNVFHSGTIGARDQNGSFISSANFTETGDTASMLEHLSAQGLCSDDDAPYLSKFFPQGSTSLVWNKIADFFSAEHGKSLSRGALCLAAREALQAMSPDLSSPRFMDLVSNMTNNLYNADSASQYLKSVLVNKSCSQNRTELPPFSVNRVNATGRELGQTVLEQLQSGTALELSIDAGKAFPDLGEGAGHMHAVAVIGNRMVNGRCQLKIRNSWGEEWENRHNGGWFDADQILSSGVGASWIKQKTS